MNTVTLCQALSNAENFPTLQHVFHASQFAALIQSNMAAARAIEQRNKAALEIQNRQNNSCYITPENLKYIL